MSDLRSARGFITSTLLCLATTSRAFLSIPYNTSHYFGPDGPWQAVSVGLKYPTDSAYSTVNVYPGNLYNTVAALYVPTSQICANDTTGSCAAGGTVSPLTSTNGSSWYTYLDQDTGYYFYYNGSTAYMDVQLPQGITFNQAIIDVCDVGQVTYPNGKTVAIEVGLAALGGSPLSKDLNAPLSLYQGGITHSNTFGLHIGAVQFGYPGSLIFGGYDRGRVIGPVLSYDAHSALGLLDITIGVEAGATPFNGFDFKQDLLQIPNSGGVTQSISSYLKPEYPYMYLPQLTIEAITANLPVNFDSSSGYWLWDVSNPQYKKIVTGAGYLGFVFPSLTGNTANETIKVPFALLNLTLESSVSGLDSDVPYFPVMQTEVSESTGYPILLGRAFMQAAFTGTNWATNVSWLAQAPGPGAAGEGLGQDPVDLDNLAQTLDVQSGDNLFNQTWAGHWTVLSNSTGNGNGNGNGGNNNGGGGLSGGAIAGIVIGAVAVIALIAVGIFFLMRRRKRRATATIPPGGAYHDDKTQQHGGVAGPPQYGEQLPHVNELDGAAQDAYYKPAPQQQQWHEVDGRGHYSELPGAGPAELPGSHNK